MLNNLIIEKQTEQYDNGKRKSYIVKKVTERFHTRNDARYPVSEKSR